MISRLFSLRLITNRYDTEWFESGNFSSNDTIYFYIDDTASIFLNLLFSYPSLSQITIDSKATFYKIMVFYPLYMNEKKTTTPINNKYQMFFFYQYLTLHGLLFLFFFLHSSSVCFLNQQPMVTSHVLESPSHMFEPPPLLIPISG